MYIIILVHVWVSLISVAVLQVYTTWGRHLCIRPLRTYLILSCLPLDPSPTSAISHYTLSVGTAWRGSRRCCPLSGWWSVGGSSPICSAWSMVSGSGFPRVSGNKRLMKLPRRDNIPKMTRGTDLDQIVPCKHTSDSDREMSCRDLSAGQ